MSNAYNGKIWNYFIKSNSRFVISIVNVRANMGILYNTVCSSNYDNASHVSFGNYNLTDNAAYAITAQGYTLF